MAWQPQAAQLSQLIQCLKDSLSSVQSARQAAELVRSDGYGI